MGILILLVMQIHLEGPVSLCGAPQDYGGTGPHLEYSSTMEGWISPSELEACIYVKKTWFPLIFNLRNEREE